MNNVTLLFLICLLPITAFSQQSIDSANTPSHFKRAFTVQPFSPTTGSLKFNYNQALPNNLALDFGLGIIGPNTNGNALNSKGVTAKVGLKMFFAPDYYMAGQKRYSDFQGAYFEPEIAISAFSYRNFYEPIDNQNFSSAILLNFGKQRIVGNRFLLDMWVGIGYSLTKSDDDVPFYKYEYAEIPEIGLATTTGFAIGFLTK